MSIKKETTSTQHQHDDNDDDMQPQQHQQHQEQPGEFSSLLQHNKENNSTTTCINSPSGRRSIIYAYAGSPCNSHSSRGRRRQLSSRSSSSKTSIPSSLRWITNASSLLSALLFTGIIFGWAPLKLILIREGQYQELCTTPTSTITTTTNSSENNISGIIIITPCVQQLDRFNLIFTLAQFFLSFCSLPVGFFLDHASVTIHYALAAIFQVGGLILFGISESNNQNNSIGGGDYFVLAYSCMALGGCMTMLGAFPASFLLPRHQPAILAAISCLFDASSIIFAIFNRLEKKMYNNSTSTTTSTLFSRRHLFLTYAIVAIFIYSILSYCWVLIEKHDWKSIVETESQTAATKINTRQQQQQEKAESNDNDPKSSSATKGDVGDGGDDDSHLLQCRRRGMHEWSLSRQLQTFEFILVLTFASIHMLRCNFYIETVNEILASVAIKNGQDNHDDAVLYANIFSFVLPIGIIFVPLIEATVRRFGIVQTLHFTNVLGIIFGALLLIPSLYVQAFNFLIFTCFRAYLYATLNTFIALTFGVSTMGRMIGSTFTTAAIVTLLQYPAAAMAQERFHNDYTVANVVMLAACTLPTGLAMLYSSGRNGRSSHHDETTGKV